MKIICSACKKDMGEKAPFEDKAISHTICPDCAIELYGDVIDVSDFIEMKKRHGLESQLT